jgi:hypothetical protein
MNDLLQFPANLNARKEDNSSSRTMSTRPAFYSQSDAANYIKFPPLNVNLSHQTNFTAVFVLTNRDSGKGSSSYPIPDSDRVDWD